MIDAASPASPTSPAIPEAITGGIDLATTDIDGLQAKVVEDVNLITHDNPGLNGMPHGKYDVVQNVGGRYGTSLWRGAQLEHGFAENDSTIYLVQNGKIIKTISYTSPRENYNLYHNLFEIGETGNPAISSDFSGRLAGASFQNVGGKVGLIDADGQEIQVGEWSLYDVGNFPFFIDGEAILYFYAKKGEGYACLAINVGTGEIHTIDGQEVSSMENLGTNIDQVKLRDGRERIVRNGESVSLHLGGQTISDLRIVSDVPSGSQCLQGMLGGSWRNLLSSNECFKEGVDVGTFLDAIQDKDSDAFGELQRNFDAIMEEIELEQKHKQWLEEKFEGLVVLSSTILINTGEQATMHTISYEGTHLSGISILVWGEREGNYSSKIIRGREPTLADLDPFIVLRLNLSKYRESYLYFRKAVRNFKIIGLFIVKYYMGIDDPHLNVKTLERLKADALSQGTRS